MKRPKVIEKRQTNYVNFRSALKFKKILECSVTFNTISFQ